ncbi:MAG TPA: hypothetical protein PKC96_04690 [Bacilli bacterium]|nr:hypothetical protein [Bacilli bacterium]
MKRYDKLENIIVSHSNHDVKTESADIISVYHRQPILPKKKPFFERFFANRLVRSFSFSFGALALVIGSFFAFGGYNLFITKSSINFVARPFTDDPLKAVSLQLITGEQLFYPEAEALGKKDNGNNQSEKDKASSAYKKFSKLIDQFYSFKNDFSVESDSGFFLFEGKIFDYRISIANDYYFYYSGEEIGKKETQISGYFVGENGTFSISAYADKNGIGEVELLPVNSSTVESRHLSTKFDVNDGIQKIDYQCFDGPKQDFTLSFSIGYNENGQEGLAYRLSFMAPGESEIEFIVEDNDNCFNVFHESNGRSGNFEIDHPGGGHGNENMPPEIPNGTCFKHLLNNY